MGISGVGAMGSMSGGQMSAVQRTDSVSKNIQNEISEAQRQKQSLSSKGDISAKEKMKKDQELQQEISSLNTQLRMRQEEVQKEQKKEALSGEVRPVREDEKKVENRVETKEKSIGEIRDQEQQARKLENFETQSKDTEKEKEKEDTETTDSRKETKAVVAGDSGMEQVKQQRRVITRMKDAIAVLKGEIRQDEARGLDVEDKKKELEEQEDKMQKASASQFSVLGEANKAMGEAQGKTQPAGNGDNEEQAMIKATNFVKENNDAMQFFVR